MISFRFTGKKPPKMGVNIDWTTINTVHINETYSVSNVGSTYKNMYTYNVEKAGLYFFSFNYGSGNYGSTKANLDGRLRINDVNKYNLSAESVANYAGNNFAHASFSLMAMCEVGDVVTFTCNSSNATTTVGGRVVIERVS